MFPIAREPPVPPFPAPDDRRLELIVLMAIQCLDDAELDLRGAVHYAAVHGWLEGHLEGEACDADCLHNLGWQSVPYPDRPDSD